MVVKFFANKKGGSSKAIDYLLNERREQGTARLLKGDEQLTRDIIKDINYKQKTTVGCLSFEEQDISEELKQKLMEDFEKMLLPNMEDKYNILWVEHKDKGRLELNFVIPKIELESQKSLNPYYHKADLPRVEMWQDIQNLEHNFTNPKDPSKARTLQTDSKEIGLSNDYEQLNELLHNLVKQGQIKNRDNLIELLQNNSIEVTRTGKDYLAIKLPDSKKAKRFKGSIYDEEFTSIGEFEKISDRAIERVEQFNSRDTQTELRETKQRLEEYIRTKSIELTKKYQKGKDTNSYSNTYLDNTEHSNDIPSYERAIKKRNSITAERREVHTTGAKQNIERQQILQTGEINNDTIRTDVIERIRREREERQRDLQSAIRSLKEQQHSYSNITETISRYAEKFRNFAGEKFLNLIKKTQEVLSPKKEEIKTYKPTKRREQGQGRGY